MRHRVVFVLVLVVIAPLAGCGVAPSGRSDGGPSGAAATVTPAAVPTDRGTPMPPPEVAPGVTQSGTVTAVVLAEAHRDALVGDSFTRRTTRTIREDGDPLRRTTRIYRVAPFRPQFEYRQQQTFSGSFPARASVDRLDVWSNGTGAVARLEADDEVRYREVNAEQFSTLVVGITGHERVSALTGAFEFGVRDGAKAGTVRLVSTRLRSPAALDKPVLTTDVRNATLSMVVTESGLVESYRLAYDVSLDGRTLRVVETATLSDVDTTRVERPSWYELAVRSDRATANGTTTPPDEN